MLDADLNIIDSELGQLDLEIKEWISELRDLEKSNGKLNELNTLLVKESYQPIVQIVKNFKQGQSRDRTARHVTRFLQSNLFKIMKLILS